MDAWKARLTSAQKEELVMVLAKLKKAKIGVSQDGANLRVKFDGFEAFDAKGNVDVYSLAERIGVDIMSLDSSYTKLGSIEQIKLKTAVANIFANATNEEFGNANVASYSLHLSNALDASGIKTDFDPKTATTLAFLLAQPRYEKIFDSMNHPGQKGQAKFDVVQKLVEDLETIGIKFKSPNTINSAVVDGEKLNNTGEELVFNEPDVIRNYALKLASEATQPIGLVMKFHRTCIQRSLSVALDNEPTLPQEFIAPSVRDGLVSLFHSVKSGDSKNNADFLSKLRFVDDSGRNYSESFDLAMDDKIRLRKGAFLSHFDKMLSSQPHISSEQASSILSNVGEVFQDESLDSDISSYIALDALRESSRLLSTHFVKLPYESMMDGVNQFKTIVQAPYSTNIANAKKINSAHQDIEEKPAPKPETKPAPKPETKPAPKPETKPAPKPETKPAPNPETKPAPKPETKPAPKPEAKPAPKPEAKPAPNPETKPAPKPEAKPAPKPEAKPAPKPEAKVESAVVNVDTPVKNTSSPKVDSAKSMSTDELKSTKAKEIETINSEIATKALDAFKGELIDKCFRGDEVELPDVMDWVEKRWRDTIDSMTDAAPDEKLNRAQVEFHGLTQSRNFRKSKAWYEQSIERFEMSSDIDRDITKILESLQSIKSDDPKISEALAMYQGAMLENMMPVLGEDGMVHPLADLERLESARNGVRDSLMPIAKALLDDDLEPLKSYANLLDQRSEMLNKWKEKATTPESDNALAHHWEALFPSEKALSFSELEKSVSTANDLISSPDTVLAMLEKPVDEGSGSLAMVWDKEQLIGTSESAKPKAYENPILKSAEDFLRVEEPEQESVRPSIKH
jgi:hypothetical protein